MFQKDKHNLVRLHKKKLKIKPFTDSWNTLKKRRIKFPLRWKKKNRLNNSKIRNSLYWTTTNIYFMPEVRTTDKEKATKYVCMLSALTPREQIIVLLLLLSTENGAKCLNQPRSVVWMQGKLPLGTQLSETTRVAKNVMLSKFFLS